MKSLLGALGRRRGAFFVAMLMMVAVLVLPARAEPAPLPDSCKLHPTQVVNPGCIPAATEEVEGAIADATGLVTNPPHTYPDLVPDVTEVYIDRPWVQDPVTGGFYQHPDRHLFFDTWSQNLGTVAVDLLTDDPTNGENPTASQCLAWALDVCRERRTVGGFEIHPAHGHFHFNDFAQYELRRTLADGTTDFSDAGVVGLAEKVSFCLFDSWQVRSDARPTGTYTFCGWTREGISAGWSDIYGAGLEGQQFNVEGLPDGRYTLIISMNPVRNLYEADYGNNVLRVTVEISGGLSAATIVEKHLQ